MEKIISDFPEYKINDNGEVFSSYKYKTNIITTEWRQVKPVLDSSCGYYVVCLINSTTKLRRNKTIHRLLMEAFVPNLQNKAHVNHIDGNKLNNALVNLEWSTPQENSQHAVDNGLTTYEAVMKEVHQYTLSGVYIASFISDTEAHKHTNVAKQNISKTVLGHRSQAGGYQWSRVKTSSMLKYVGNPIPKNILVLHKWNNLTVEYKPSSPYVAKQLGLNSNSVSRYLTQDSRYETDDYIITRIYYT